MLMLKCTQFPIEWLHTVHFYEDIVLVTNIYLCCQQIIINCDQWGKKTQKTKWGDIGITQAYPQPLHLPRRLGSLYSWAEPSAAQWPGHQT